MSSSRKSGVCSTKRRRGARAPKAEDRMAQNRKPSGREPGKAKTKSSKTSRSQSAKARPKTAAKASTRPVRAQAAGGQLESLPPERRIAPRADMRGKYVY